uniref:G-protein coupled receptors family 1 profile domain-containing protein n=1 Tax=Sphenodon punctatus TaxID=8508 RepID=A0A8D0HBB2_SPHPU
MENTTSFPLSLANSSGPYEDHYEYYDDYSSNETTALLKKMHILTMVIYSLAFVLGVMGNGLVIFITGFRMKRTVNTVWFLNLAVADFIFTFFLPLSVAYVALGFHWPFGRALCKLNSTVAFLNLYASVYLLMIISIDRYVSVMHPVWAKNHRTPRLASFLALGIWILAFVLCSATLYFRSTVSPPHDNRIIHCFNDFDTAGEGTTKEERQYWISLNSRAIIISRFIFGFLIPFTVIVGCYSAIVLKLRWNRLAHSSKPFKVIAAVIVTFFLCWFPYHVFSFLEMNYRPELRIVLIIGIPLTSSLAFINSFLNPFLYVFMGKDFKDKLRRSFLSAFESSFSEEASSNTTNIRSKSTTESDSHAL